MVDSRDCGFVVPEVLLPAANINLEKWACIACDQFTSQPEYWEEVEKLVGSAASTLRMMLPEVYLDQDDLTPRIVDMKEHMEKYLEDGTLEILPRGIVLTERYLGDKVRKGILLAVDLEQYDYEIANKPMIRATEETLLSRIPPRVEIRQDALLEMPHIMLMIDDPEDRVIGGLHLQKSSMNEIYDFDLMMDGGRIKGYFTDEKKMIDETIAGVAGLEAQDNMLFCVGDGNHSLATAKTIWDETKEGLTEEQRKNHPLRYCLCEVINLRDRAVEFLPIHRMLFNVNPASCAQFVVERLNENGRDAKLVFGRWNDATRTEQGDFVVPFVYYGGAGKIIIENPEHPLAVGEVQDILEEFIEQTKNSSIDYIHGDETFLDMATNNYDTIGFFFDALDKEEFFDLIIQCGVLPKKTFSLGEAEEKRYYLESRLLVSLSDGPGHTNKRGSAGPR